MARIRVRCGVCNARLKVPEAVCGGVIRCHHCKAKILVPSRSVQGTKTIQLRTSEAGFDVKEQPWLRVQCDCGKVIKAPIEWAGKIGHCPRCGKAHKMPPADSAISSTLMRVKRVDAFATRDGDEFTLDDSVEQSPQSNMTLIAAPLTGPAASEKEISIPDPDIEASEIVSELAGGGKGGKGPATDEAQELTPSTLDALDKGAESSTIHDPSERIKPRVKPSKGDKGDPRRSVRPVGKPKVVPEESSVHRPSPTPKVKLDGPAKPTKPEEVTDFKSYIETSGISLPNIGGFDPDIIEEDDSKYLRVVCSHCGKRVKAPPELSGKTGVCPACGGTIAMPMADAAKFGPVVKLDGISTDDSLLAALDEIAPAPQDALGLETTDASGSGLLNAAQSEQQLMTIEGMTASEWEAEKERRAKSIMRYRRGYLYWVLSRSFGWVITLFDGARTLPHASPVVAIAIMVGLFLAAASASWSQMPDDYKSVNRNLIIPEYFFNGATGTLEEIGSEEAWNKIDRVYRAGDFETKDVLFKATVLSCADCGDITQRKVGYIEKLTPEGRAGLEKRIEAISAPEFAGYAEADAQVKKGTFVANTTDFKWYEYNSPEGQALVNMPFKCAGDMKPLPCFPEVRQRTAPKPGAADPEPAKPAEKPVVPVPDPAATETPAPADGAATTPPAASDAAPAAPAAEGK
jgi:hypothetical protein